MNRQLTGWIAAAVLAVALGGVLVYQAVDDDGAGSSAARRAALATGGQAGIAATQEKDFDQIQDRKDAESNNREIPETNEQAPDIRQSTRCNPGDEPNVFAEWRNNPETLSQAGEMSDSIVVGTVMGVKQGRPLVPQLPEGAEGPDNVQGTPVQDVTVRVNQSVKGDAQEGGTITVQRLGDSRGCFRVAGDEPYQQGQQYLLLLEDGAGNRPSHVISPEGRYQVTGAGTLRSLNENDLSEDVDGKRLQQVLNQLGG